MRHDEADEDDKVGGSAEDDGDSEGNDHDVDDRSAGAGDMIDMMMMK